MTRLSSKSLRSRLQKVPQKGTNGTKEKGKSRFKNYSVFYVPFVLLCGLSICFPVATQQRVLKDVFKNDFMIGAALNRRQIFEEDTRGAEIVKTQFNSITPENVLKWALVHPVPGRYDFAAPDRFVEFGEKHGMFVVGHTLVWHNQTPRWVFA